MGENNNKEKSFWQLMGEYAKIGIEIRKEEVKGVFTEIKEFGSLLLGAGKAVLKTRISDLQEKKDKKDENK